MNAPESGWLTGDPIGENLTGQSSASAPSVGGSKTHTSGVKLNDLCALLSQQTTQYQAMAVGFTN